jgi:hypothetical protein
MSTTDQYDIRGLFDKAFAELERKQSTSRKGSS